jgi:hypothetical protein
MRGADHPIAVRAEVAVALVVRDDQDNVWPGRRRSGGDWNEHGRSQRERGGK